MALRAGHGKGAGTPHIEVLPPDELGPPVPATLPDDSCQVRRGQDGRFADSESAKVIARRGGLAKARRVRLIDSLGLKKIAESADFKPYRDAAEEFTSHHLSELAKQAGGSVGPAPSTMVASAALQLAASRWAFDRGAAENDPALIKLGSSLANDSRQNLLAAYELATREAVARTSSRDAFAGHQRTEGGCSPRCEIPRPLGARPPT
jgi:hypothetical protein